MQKWLNRHKQSWILWSVIVGRACKLTRHLLRRTLQGSAQHRAFNTAAKNQAWLQQKFHRQNTERNYTMAGINFCRWTCWDRWRRHSPAPDELLEAALASCSAITIKMYAERKGWTLAAAEVNVSLVRINGKTTIHREIALQGELDQEQKIAFTDRKALPVSKTLAGEIDILSTLKWYRCNT